MADFFIDVDPYKLIPQKGVNYLRSDIITASLSNHYSLCVEFVRAWFLQKFPSDFFDYIYIEGSNVLKEFLKPKDLQLIHKRLNHASLSITPQIDEEFNNDNHDSQMAGIGLYLRNSSSLTPFIKDVITNKAVYMEMQLLSMTFTFKVKVNTRAQQLDLYNYMKKAFRIGFTESYYADEDFLLPRTLMLCLAEDYGFGIDDKGNIKDIFKFLSILNSVSYVPILYKHRSATGTKEYYARFAETYIHYAMNNLTKDDGDRPNHLSTEYGIEMNLEVKFPAPTYYAYNTNNIDLQIPKFQELSTDASFNINTFKWDSIPSTNEKGWLLYVKDENGYIDEVFDKPLVIDFTEYFEGELADLIRSHITKYISPSLFMDLKIFNDLICLEGTMNWDKLVWTSKNPPTSGVSSIVLYMDMDYVNKQRIINLNMMDLNNRIGNEKLR